MEKYFDGLVTESARLFHKQYQHTLETKRIIPATTLVALEHSAKNIADEVNNERAVTSKNLRGIVRLEANKITKDLERKVASPQAKLNKQEGKPENANATGKKSKGKKDFRRSGKTAAADSAHTNRNAVGRQGSTTHSTANRSAKGRSKCKSCGKRYALNTNMSS